MNCNHACRNRVVNHRNRGAIVPQSWHNHTGIELQSSSPTQSTRYTLLNSNHRNQRSVSRAANNIFIKNKLCTSKVPTFSCSTFGTTLPRPFPASFSRFSITHFLQLRSKVADLPCLAPKPSGQPRFKINLKSGIPPKFSKLMRSRFVVPQTVWTGSPSVLLFYAENYSSWTFS